MTSLSSVDVIEGGNPESGDEPSGIAIEGRSPYQLAWLRLRGVTGLR